MGGTKLTARVNVPLADLAASWLLELRAEGKSPATLQAYGNSIKAFLRWHATAAAPGTDPVLDKASVSAFLADLRDAGQAPGTRRLRHAALRRFSRWLAEAGERDADLLAGLSPPKLDQPVVPHLTDAELAALVKACRPREPGFTDKRDEALVRLMTECLLRAGEALALTVADVDLGAGTALVRRGKGGKGRVVGFGPDTAAALSRYLRLRRRHPLAHTPPLWLPGAGRATLGYQGLATSIGARAKAAGIDGFHLHRLRHTGAVRWAQSGRSAVALKAMGGWASMDMVAHYVQSADAALALKEAQRTDLPPLGAF